MSDQPTLQPSLGMSYPDALDEDQLTPPVRTDPQLLRQMVQERLNTQEFNLSDLSSLSRKPNK